MNSFKSPNQVVAKFNTFKVIIFIKSIIKSDASRVVPQKIGVAM